SNFQPPEILRVETGKLRFCFRTFCRAVLMLDMKIRINSSDSFKTKIKVESFFTQCLRSTSRAQRRVSRSSLRPIFNLWMKSSRDSADSASPWFGYGEVPERKICPAIWFPAREEGSFSVKSITADANSSNRFSKSNFELSAGPSCNIQTPSADSFRVRCSMFDVRCSPFFISFLFFRPARHQLLRHAQMIQHAGNHGVHDFLDGCRFRVKTRVRRQNRRPGLQQQFHVFDVDEAQWRFARHQNQFSPL